MEKKRPKKPSYEQDLERKALRRKRNDELPHIPDFSIKLARGQIQNLVEEGQFPVDDRLREYLSKFCARNRIEEILRHPKVKKALEKARALSQLQMFGCRRLN